MSQKEFLSYWNALREISPSDAKEVLIYRCQFDLETFAVVFFPHLCKHPFNPFHYDYFNSIHYGERRVRRARGAPRGYAKSVLIALIRPIHDLCYGYEKFILLFSNTEELAIDKVKDIRTELSDNELLLEYFPMRFETSKPGATEFTVFSGDNKCTYAAFGAKKEVRGKRKGEARPSKIICDDFEDSEEVDNESLRVKYEKRFFEVISFLGDENTNIEFIGTVLHKKSLLSLILKNPAYEGKLYKAVIQFASNTELWDQWEKIYCNLESSNREEEALAFFEANKPAMLEGTEVLWPEKEPYYRLKIEIVERGWRSFQKEKQNNPIQSDEAVFTKFHWYKETKDGLLLEEPEILVPWGEIKNSAVGALDPATGSTKAKTGKKGDYAALVTGYNRKGRLFVHHAWCERKPPTSYIAEIFEHHLRFKYSKFAVEVNLYRGLLLPNIVAERKRREQVANANRGTNDAEIEIRLPFYEVENTENKRERITALEPKVSHGFIVFNRALQNTPFIDMIEQFPFADNDDGPDALEMLWKLANNFYKPSALSINAMSR